MEMWLFGAVAQTQSPDFSSKLRIIESSVILPHTFFQIYAKLLKYLKCFFFHSILSL